MFSNICYIQIFSPGTQVLYKGQPHIVDHVTVTGYDLFVTLQGVQRSVNSKELVLAPTKIILKRQ